MELMNKTDFENLALRILDPLKPYYSEHKALLKLGVTSAHYPDLSAWIEAFSRPLWGLVPLWAGGVRTPEFESIYLQGLIAGTDPESKEYWGKCWQYDQRFVEMCAIAYALIFTPHIVWEPLNKKQQENLVEWLWEINRNDCCECNWKFFNVLVNVALKKLGQSYSEKELEASLAYIDSCYVDNGWYTDGLDGHTDYYIPFAMHFYGIIYALAMKDENAERSQRFLERAERFARDFVYWFAGDGSAVVYGRSMTYRFAQSAFYSACILAHIEPLPLGVMKGIIVRHMQYWMKQPIFDRAGLLTIGYCYPNLHMAESYNAPGSPYWAMKAFAYLALPADDPFWHAKAEPLPELQRVKYLKEANMIIQRDARGNVTAFPGGRLIDHMHMHTEEKYCKFAYSSRFGFSVMQTAVNLEEAAPDSVLSFEVFGHIFHRGQAGSYQVEADRVCSEWSPLPGIKVYSTIIPTDEGHRRIHVIDSEYDCKAYDAGFAVPMDDKEACQVRSEQGELMLLKPNANTNLVRSKTYIPMAVYEIKKGRQTIATEIIY